MAMNNPPDDVGFSGADYSRPSKVMIPRMIRPEPPPSTKSEPVRVSKACINCRKRKVKCTGDTPSCKQCEQSGAHCAYEPHRRDRLQTQRARINDLVTLLKDLSLRASDEDKGKISLLLQGGDLTDDHDTASSTVRDDKSLSTITSAYDSAKDPDRHPRRHSSSLSVSDDYTRITSATDNDPDDPLSKDSDNQTQPSGPSGTLDEDLLRSKSSRETGLVGSMSEMHWLRIFYNQKQSTPFETASAYNPTLTQRYMESFSYYVDDLPVDLGISINPHELPNTSIARRLFGCYMSVVHREFPILPDSFAGEFEKMCHASDTGFTIQVSSQWKTLLNLVFAIGAYFSHLANAQWKGNLNDHKVYMSRATQLLGIDNTISLFSAPDDFSMQALALLSFYFMTTGHVGRSWSVIGLSLRSALSLGLHLRNGDTTMEPSKKKALVRTWWGLHSVECLLSSVTGRPSVAANEHITVLLPDKLSKPRQEKKRAGAVPFLDGHIMIGLITQDVLTHLYSQRTVLKTSGQLQSIVASLMKTLNNWAHQAIPEGLPTAKSAKAAHMERGHLIFVFYYYKTKILITRPCLQRLNAHVKERSGEDPAIIQKTAEDCVRAALDLAAMLPDTPDPRWLYENGPWWSVVHIFMQGLTVLILEITYPSRKANLLNLEESIVKLLSWLKSMRGTNGVAKRAYYLVSGILLHLGPQIPVDLRNFLLSDNPGPGSGSASQPTNILEPHEYNSPWATPFGPDPLGQMHGQEYLSHPFAPQPFNDPAIPFAGERSQGNIFDSTVPFVPGDAGTGHEDLLFPLQNMPAMDFRADPRSPNQHQDMESD